MNLLQRYNKLSFWNKIQFWAAIATFLGLLLTLGAYLPMENKGNSRAGITAKVISQMSTEGISLLTFLQSSGANIISNSLEPQIRLQAQELIRLGLLEELTKDEIAFSKPPVPVSYGLKLTQLGTEVRAVLISKGAVRELPQ